MDDYFNSSPIGKVFRSIPYGIVRADIFRLCVLLIHGGIYLDLKEFWKFTILNALDLRGNCFINNSVAEIPRVTVVLFVKNFLKVFFTPPIFIPPLIIRL